MSRYIHGIHDPGGEHLFGDRPGWVVHTVDVRSDAPLDYRAHAARGIGAIGRLNWSYGQGTIPDRGQWTEYVGLCAAYAHQSRGCDWWIIANEPNHPQEQIPDGPPLTADFYGECYLLAYDTIKAAAPHARIMPAAIAPWTVQGDEDWITYFRRLLARISGKLDGICLHTYSRGYDPRSVTDNRRMDAPYTAYYNGFRSYWDFLDAVPDSLRHLPVHITETNGNEPWPDANTGWVQSAYAEIDRHNRLAGTQKVHSLCLFRWPRFDARWQFETKAGVHEDFKAAVAKGYTVPDVGAAGSQDTRAYVPIVAVGDAPSTPSTPPSTPSPTPLPTPSREWDPRLTARGVAIETPLLNAGDVYLRVVRGVWLDEQQAQGRHHIFADVRDADGARIVGQRLAVVWPTGGAAIVTEAKPGEEWSANYPMSPSRNEFAIQPVGGYPAERVTGIGMGAETPGGYNAGIHTSTGLVWQVSHYAGQSKPQKPVEQPKPEPTRTPTVPPLVHPVADPAYRTVTQRFGERPDYYRQFSVDGVPLRGHNGVDFGTPEGTVIVAVADGRVAEVAHDPTGYGVYVKLDHPWGQSLYAHLQHNPPVEVGQQVIAGQRIGYSGNTGNSTGAHLHIGLRVAPFNRADGWGGFTDPLPYLPPDYDLDEIVDLIRTAASRFGVDANLLLSQLFAESSFDPRAVSGVGAKGLGQIMDATFAEWGPRVGATDPFDPRDSARVAAAYLAWLRGQVDTDWQALVAYGWGLGNYQSGKPVPPSWGVYADKIMHGKWLLDAVRG